MPSLDVEVPPQASPGLRGVWDVLTAPSRRLLEPEARRRARLLAAVLVFLIPLSLVLTGLLPWATIPDYDIREDTTVLLGLVTIALSVPVYALSRTRHFQVAAHAAVLTTLVGCWSTLLTSIGTIHEGPAPYFVGLSVLMGSIFLSSGVTVTLVVLNLCGMALLPAFFSSVDYYTVSNPGFFLLFLSTFLVVLSRVRARDLDQIQDQARSLSRSEQRWRSLATNAPDLIMLVDRKGAVQFVNRPLTGAASKPGATQLRQYLPAECDIRFEEPLDAVFRTATTRFLEVGCKTSAGARTWHSLRILPVGHEASVEAAIVVWSDTTDIKSAEEERIRRYERDAEVHRLQEIATFKTDFINTAAHELSTPLTPIKLQVHLLKQAVSKRAPEARSSLDILERNVERMRLLLQDVLDGARIQAGRLGLQAQALDLAHVVHDAIESHQALAHQRGLQLEANSVDSLPLRGDPRRLLQVLYNLLGNAIKFTGAGGTIRVRLFDEPGQAHVVVQDTGRGVTEDQLPRLFQPFSQVHDTTPHPQGGTGLGLYISRGIIEQHHGHIWCESPGPGLGSAFHVVLPKPAHVIESPTATPVNA